MIEVPVKNYYADIPLTGGHIWHKLMYKRSTDVETKKAFIDAHTDRFITHVIHLSRYDFPCSPAPNHNLTVALKHAACQRDLHTVL